MPGVVRGVQHFVRDSINVEGRSHHVVSVHTGNDKSRLRKEAEPQGWTRGFETLQVGGVKNISSCER